MSERKYTLIHGEAIQEMRKMKTGSFGGMLTDPPYASGGQSSSARQQTTAQKYTEKKGNHPLPNFLGDQLDQRSWTNWSAVWLMEARRLCRENAPICIFTDWRQLPSLTDALQWAGWIWRGVAVWDKKNSRPRPGGFRQDAEFIVWATNGVVEKTETYLPGVFSVSPVAPAKRIHQAEKPITLIRELMRIFSADASILDPFAGSGTTLVAGILDNRSVVGIEHSEAYATVAENRLHNLCTE